MATFWLHFDYILTTLWLHCDYILTTFWLHTDCILTTFWLHSDCKMFSLFFTTSLIHRIKCLVLFHLHITKPRFSSNYGLGSFSTCCLPFDKAPCTNSSFRWCPSARRIRAQQTRNPPLQQNFDFSISNSNTRWGKLWLAYCHFVCGMRLSWKLVSRWLPLERWRVSTI